MGWYARANRRAVKEALMNQEPDMLDFISHGHELVDILMENECTDVLRRNIDNWISNACRLLEDYWRADND